MNPGKNNFKFVIVFSIIISTNLYAEEKISSVPLVNLENLKPSYEEVENEDGGKILDTDNSILKKKKKVTPTSNKASINILGLDKITAKTTELNIKLGETKKFGLLEIKAIRCGKLKSVEQPGEAAYIQIKDLSDNNNEKVFVFNGWTFSSSKSLQPIDHPVYDVWLISCENV
jgi:hypothetical protein